MKIVFQQSTLDAMQKSRFFTRGAEYSVLKAASPQGGLNTAGKKDDKFRYFQKKIIEHIAELEGEESNEVNKSLFYMVDAIVKSKFPVGTIREWKGKKYIKIAPGKWRAKYESNSRSAKLAVAALKRKAEQCKTSQELLQLVLENRDRFSDKDGRPLPFVQELRRYVSELNDRLENQAAEQPKAKASEQKSGKNDTGDDGYPEKDYSEYKGKGQKAVDFIVKQKSGQVRGAFNRPEIGDIDVVWGKVTNAEKHKGYGLAHIIDKHGMDAAKKIGEIIKDGDCHIDNNGIATISHKDYKVGLSKGWHGKYKNHWIVTAYKKQRGTGKTFDATSQSSKTTLSETPHEESRGQTTTPSPQSDYTKGTDSATSATSIPQSGKKSSEIQQIRNKYESAPSVTGNKKTVTLPNGTKIKCRYKLVEADAPTASHDENTYSPTKGFPTSKGGKTVNDRDYQNDKDAQESVRKIAANFNSLALESPPIVTKDGIVISGNNRTMSSKLAAKNGTDTAYLEDLQELIDEYGLEESDLSDFKHPRLILEMDAEHEGDYTTEEFAQFNRDTKKTMSNVEKAVKVTKTLNEEKIQSIASQLSGYETMGELYADAKGCQSFVAKLIDAGIIGDNEKAQYLKSDGTLNDTGKDFTETVLVGTILNEDNIRRLDSTGGKRIRQKLVRAILPLVENKGTGKEYSFNKELNEAVDIAVSVAKNHEIYPNVEAYLAQGTLFGESKPDEVTGKLAKLIHDEGEKAFASRMKNLGAGLKHSAEGEMDIFLGGVETKQSLMERFLSIQKSITDILTTLHSKEQTIRSMVAEALQKQCG